MRKHIQPEVLGAALEQAQEGIVILDANLRVQFMNGAVRRLWRVSDEQADSNPRFEELVSDSKRPARYGVPADQLAAFIAHRISLVRKGDQTPQDIRTSDGRYIRSQCTKLPDGGRLLTYFDITDLVNNAETLHRLATVDPLTAVHNRRHFLQLAETEWNRFSRYQRPLSALMLDVDWFKLINDRFGHATGDAALQSVARACTIDQRRTDIVGRIGGDELAIVMPETDEVQAIAVAERISNKIKSEAIVTERGSLKITVSIGVAEASLSMSGAAALLDSADQALYMAKLAGRNCVAQFRRFDSADKGIAAE
jgi:diguanylate cyclase (GGDEF)-like protein